MCDTYFAVSIEEYAIGLWIAEEYVIARVKIKKYIISVRI